MKKITALVLALSLTACAAFKKDEAEVKTEAQTVEQAFATCAKADGSAALAAAGGWSGAASTIVGTVLAGSAASDSALDALGDSVGQDAFDCLLDGVGAVLTSSELTGALTHLKAYETSRKIKHAIGSGSSAKK